MTKKTILVTGINGFLGSHIAKQLSGEFDIIGLEKNNDSLFRLHGQNFKVYSSENENLEKVFSENKIFALIHAATIYRRESDPLENLIETNIKLPVRLLELSNKFNVSLFINTDSYFNRPNSNYAYLSDYTLSKKHALEWLREIKGKCLVINMKLFHVFGPDDSPGKFVPFIIAALKNNQTTIDLSPGEQKKDFIFVKDVVNAYKVIIDHADKFEEGISEYEVGMGTSVTIKYFVSMVKEIANSTTKLQFGALPYRENEIMDAYAANSKLLLLGWKPKYSLIEGLIQTIK